jgi:hypothetical protein
MPRYIDAEKLCKALGDMAFYQNPYKQSTILGVVESIEQFPTADVAPRAEVLEAVDKFKNDLMDVFIGLCGGDDYNRLNLLKIGDTVARVYNKHITELKKRYTEETNAEGGDGTE